MGDDNSSYEREVIATGRKGSEMFAALGDATSSFSPFVETVSQGQRGIKAISPIAGHEIVAMPISGGAPGENMQEYGAQFVRKANDQMRRIGATPVGIIDILDIPKHDDDILAGLTTGMFDECKQNNIVVMNGEYAILKHTMSRPSITGIVLGVRKIPSYDNPHYIGVRHIMNRASYMTFVSGAMHTIANADGVGNKVQLHALNNTYHFGALDAAKMVQDDAAKMKGNKERILFALIETQGVSNESFMSIRRFMRPIIQQFNDCARNNGSEMYVDHEHADDRIIGFGNITHYNINCVSVGSIYKDDLRAVSRPSEGDHLVALHVTGRPNFASNGYTAIIDWLKTFETERQKWHYNPEAQKFIQTFSKPSVPLAPLFREAWNTGLANWVTHLSGGSFKERIAEPLQKQGLYAQLDHLFPLDPVHIEFLERSGQTPTAAYGRFSMNMDGIIATKNPEALARLASQHGVGARDLGTIVRATDKAGITIRAWDKSTVNYT